MNSHIEFKPMKQNNKLLVETELFPTLINICTEPSRTSFYPTPNLYQRGLSWILLTLCMDCNPPVYVIAFSLSMCSSQWLAHNKRPGVGDMGEANGMI